MMHTVGDPFDSVDGVRGAADHLRTVQPHTNAEIPRPGATTLDLNNDRLSETVLEGNPARPDAITVDSPWLLRGLHGSQYYSRSLRAAASPADALATPRTIASVTELHRFIRDGELQQTTRTFTDSDGDGEIDSIVTQRVSYGPAPETRAEREEMLLHPSGQAVALGTSGFLDMDGEPGLERVNEDGTITPATQLDLAAQRVSLPGLIELDAFEEELYRREGER
ncbi:MAG: hypothetical protein AAFX94_03885 [Myxococcota bacterium]